MILAIDCGSTNHKVALFDQNLERRAVHSIPVAYTAREAARVEFEPERIWQQTVCLIREVCRKARVLPRRISTIALASQAQTFTILDATGRPVMPFLSWMDKRAVAESVELKRPLGKNFHSHCSFPLPVPQLQLSKLLWVRRHHPSWLAADARILSLPAFLALRLAGLHLTDTNLAAMTGLFSLKENGWWRDGLKSCQVQPEQMGGLVSMGQSVPASCACSDLDLSPQLQILFAGNDQTAGAYANTPCAARRGQQPLPMVLNLGTALVVYRHAANTPGPFSTDGCWGPYPGGGFYELATRDEGCAALDWAVEKIAPNDEAGFMKRAASAAPGSGSFYPQRIYTDEAWIGPDDLASRARAVLEGICFSARELIEDLNLKLSGKPLVVTGGGSKSPLWLEILADVLNSLLRRGEGDILLGAALMARPGVRASTRADDKVVMPDLRSVARYEQIFRVWQERKTIA